MNQAALVSDGQAARRFASHAKQFGRIQAAGAEEALFQRFALEQLHGDERHAAIFADLINGHDVVVFESGGGLGLLVEAPAVGGTGGQRRQHRLERRRTLEPNILRLENHAHAAVAENLDNAIPAQPADLVRCFRRRQKVIQFGIDRFRNRRGTGRRRIAARRFLESRGQRPFVEGGAIDRPSVIPAARFVVGTVSRAALGIGTSRTWPQTLQRHFLPAQVAARARR